MAVALYSGDPRWITARFTSSCKGCGAKVEKGTSAYYYPNTRTIYGKACGCGDDNAKDFSAASFDDDFMAAQFYPPPHRATAPTPGAGNGRRAEAVEQEVPTLQGKPATSWHNNKETP